MSCPDAFNCLNLIHKNGETYISSCCVMPGWKVEQVDFLNDPTLIKIRNHWKNGIWPNECSGCKEHENNNINSRRQGAITWAKENLNQFDNYEIELVKIDYYCGNTCNLRCAICGPYDSTAWQKELKIDKKNRKSYSNILYDNVNFDSIKWIHFNGGEPFLIDEHWELLKRIKNKNQVQLRYNTNATVLPKKELIELWSQFKNIILDFSIDDINERFEYQRYPAKWNTVIKNLFWLRENLPANVMFEVNTTLGILNYNNYNNLKKWFHENFSVNRVNDPVVLKTQPTIGTLSRENKNKKSIVKYLDLLDSRRKTNWRLIFPELIKELEI